MYKKLFFAVLAVSVFACGSVEKADMVIKNGKVMTVDSNFSQAEAVAVKGDKIVFVGTTADVEKYVGDATKVIDAEGKLVLPGLIDSHGHVSNLGSALDNVSLVGTKSFQAIIDLLVEKAKSVEPGEWIIGRGWDQNDWEIKEFPVHDALSKVIPNNPVVITRVDGHAILANAKALEMAGVTSKTQAPEGGLIYKKRNGQPTGVFIDNAMILVRKAVPALTPEKRREHLVMAAESNLSYGMTSTHDAGVSPTTVADYKHVIDNGSFGMRAYVMYRTNEEDLEKFFTENKIIGYANDMLTARSMKISIDGALGSRGAAMIEDYSDAKGEKGLIITPYERVLQAARVGLKMGWQINTHAIGDRGNRFVLDAFEKALKENPQENHRFRIEHSQIVSPEDIPRFKEIGIIPAMQATHATSDMYWAEDRVGPKRILGSYAWQTFLKDGHHIPNGSDYPVEHNDIMLGVYASITRQDAEEWPDGGWYPKERMTREQTLKSFTIWAAEAAFQEDIIGSLEVGKYADIVVLNRDIMTIPALDILGTRPVYTIVGGKIRYENK